MRLQCCCRREEDGTRNDKIQMMTFLCQSALDCIAHCLRSTSQTLKLLCKVGNNASGRIRRSRRAEICHIIQKWRIAFVSDCRHQGSGGGCSGTHQGLVREGKKILNGTAASSNNNHVNFGDLIELGNGITDLAHRVLALDCDLADLETRGGPACTCIHNDIIFCLCISPAHKANNARKERKRFLAAFVEEAFGCKFLTQAFDLSQ